MLYILDIRYQISHSLVTVSHIPCLQLIFYGQTYLGRQLLLFSQFYSIKFY